MAVRSVSLSMYKDTHINPFAKLLISLMRLQEFCSYKLYKYFKLSGNYKHTVKRDVLNK